MKTRTLLLAAAALLASTAAYAEISKFSCKAKGRTSPALVDETKMSLMWRGKQYGLNKASTDVCGYNGWHAEGNGTSLLLCQSNRGNVIIWDKDGNQLADCEWLGEH